MDNSIGRFKFPYYRSIPFHKLKKWIDETDTKSTEDIIGNLFTKYLREFESRQVLYFSRNNNDAHKNPDLFFHIEGKIVGAQVTQLVLNNYLSKFNQAKDLCEYISDKAREVYIPPIKVNVQIFTPFVATDLIPQGRKPIFKKLSRLIAESIKDNIGHLSSKNEYMNFAVHESTLKQIAGNYSLYPVPDDCYSNYFGEKIFVDYGFDNVFISPTDISSAVDRIYNSKNEGHSEMLIIWGDERQFMDTEIEIIETLKDKFSHTSFSEVYFMTFYNVENFGNGLIHVDKIV